MNSKFWKNKRVLVTGGAGFIGSHVVEQLVGFRARVTVLDDFSNGSRQNLASVLQSIKVIKGDATNLQTCLKACVQQDILINMVAKVGGIEFNRTHQAEMFYQNMLLELAPIEAARLSGVDRVLMVSSACVYPRNASIPTPESEGFIDEPEPTNSGYGWAKRMGEIAARLYAEQYGLKTGVVRPYNCYGPRDHFDPEKSHVIPALIKRVMDGENPIPVWGSGKQTRSFLYVDDLARGIILAAENLPFVEPVNLGSTEEVTMKELVELIKRISGSNAPIKLDKTKPDGSPRRVSDNRLAEKLFGFKPNVGLEEGLRRTIEWYSNRLMIND